MTSERDLPPQVADQVRRLERFVSDPRCQPPPERLGRCYELALDAVVTSPNLTLVHGTIAGPLNGRPVRHAWATDGIQVWEPVTGSWFDADDFAWLYAAQPRVTYKGVRAAHLSTEHRHAGPWPGDDPDPDDEAHDARHGPTAP